MKKYEISVVMSTYNETPEELKKSIESILNQSYSNFEFIIILDNPQNKEHKNIINDYCKKDNRIKFIINDKNIGLANSLNKGIESSCANYIARMDADDIAYPDRLEKEFIILEQNSEIDIVSTNKIEIDENDNVINISRNLPSDDKTIKLLLNHMSIIVHPTVMFRKNKILKIGKYRNFPASQDYDLWMRAKDFNLSFYIINEPLIKYRNRSNNITNKNSLKQWIIHEYIFKLHKERKKNNNKDTFSDENLNNYLRKYKAEEKTKIEKFKLGMKKIELAKKKAKNKKIFSASFYIIGAFFTHSKIKNVIYSYIACYLIKRRVK